MEFITPKGDTQIGINPRFNEQDEDEFRLQDVFLVGGLLSRNAFTVVDNPLKRKYLERSSFISFLYLLF